MDRSLEVRTLDRHILTDRDNASAVVGAPSSKDRGLDWLRTTHPGLFLFSRLRKKTSGYSFWDRVDHDSQRPKPQ